MHSISMVHGDLKGVRFHRFLRTQLTHCHGNQPNILINQRYRVCLAGFGLSTIVGVGPGALGNASSTSVASLVSFTAGGTTRWMSPELLDPDRFGTGDCRPTKQSDCYALGMVVYEVRKIWFLLTFATVGP